MTIPLFGNFGQMAETANQPAGLLRGLMNWNDYQRNAAQLAQQRQQTEQQSLAFPYALKQEQIKAQYAQPTAAADLLKTQLSNQYYGRAKEAEINNMLAEAKLRAAQTETEPARAYNLRQEGLIHAKNAYLAQQTMDMMKDALSGNTTVPQSEAGAAMGLIGAQPTGYQQIQLPSGAAGKDPTQPPSNVMHGGYNIGQTLPISPQQRENQNAAYQQSGITPDIIAPKDSQGLPNPNPQMYSNDQWQKMIRLNNILKATGRGGIPDVENAMAIRKAQQMEEAKLPGQIQQAEAVETAKIQTKDKADLFKMYAQDAEKASMSENNLKRFGASFDKALLKGPIFGKGSSLDPDSQVAMKNAAQLLVDNMYQFKGLGQIRNAEIKALAQGLPDIKLSPQAAHEIVGQLRLANSMIMEKNKLAQQLSPYLKDPTQLRTALTYVMNTLSPVDAKGVQHPEDINLWKEYMNPEAIKAISSGQDYIPDSLVPKIKLRHLDNFSDSQLQMYHQKLLSMQQKGG